MTWPSSADRKRAGSASTTTSRSPNTPTRCRSNCCAPRSRRGSPPRLWKCSTAASRSRRISAACGCVDRRRGRAHAGLAPVLPGLAARADPARGRRRRRLRGSDRAGAGAAAVDRRRHSDRGDGVPRGGLALRRSSAAVSSGSDHRPPGYFARSLHARVLGGLRGGGSRSGGDPPARVGAGFGADLC